MKNILKNILIVISLLFICNNKIFAQDFNAYYGYDANGNMYQASVTYLTTTIQSATIPLDSVIKKDTLSEKTNSLPKDGWVSPSMDSSFSIKIRLYPNPSHGILLVEIGDVSDNQINNSNNIIHLWDVQGKEVFTIQPISYYNSVDMSSLPNGLYLISININGKTMNYKIVKN